MIRKPVKQEGKFVRQSGGKASTANVVLEIEPQERGAGYVFENVTVGGLVPKNTSGGRQGIASSDDQVRWSAIRLVDLKIVVDGSFHEVDSNEMAPRSPRR